MVSDTFSVATEEELYAEVARAWYRMRPVGSHVERPIRPYAIGPDFAYQIWSQREDDAQHIIVLCVQIVTLDYWELCGVTRTDDVDGQPREPLDPASAWWQPIEELPERGVHYWVLGSGTIELRSVATCDAPPAPLYGRVESEATSPKLGEQMVNNGA